MLTRDMVSEYEVHKFSAFASDFLPVGHFPRTLATDLGNGRDFVIKGSHFRDGDLEYVEYVQAGGCAELLVYND
jgi:hypothetical protein